MEISILTVKNIMQGVLKIFFSTKLKKELRPEKVEM